MITLFCRCGCFCCTRRTGRELVPTETDENIDESEEREQLHEPLDQISLSSVDSVEPEDELRTSETAV